MGGETHTDERAALLLSFTNSFTQNGQGLEFLVAPLPLRANLLWVKYRSARRSIAPQSRAH